jgi:hypothetical protein
MNPYEPSARNGFMNTIMITGVSRLLSGPAQGGLEPRQ